MGLVAFVGLDCSLFFCFINLFVLMGKLNWQWLAAVQGFFFFFFFILYNNLLQLMGFANVVFYGFFRLYC